ncbi:hypothetical protein D3C72_2458410 [compost metagenome]
MPTAAVANILVSQEKVSDELAYQMTRLMFDNLNRLSTAHSVAKEISLETATQNLPIPLHPGAERYFKEQGAL